MKKFLVLFLTSIVFTNTMLVSIALGDVPKEVQQETKSNIDISGKVWNRWTSENFVVCSLSDTQAKYLNFNLEQVKTWIYTRWGMPDTKFSAECRLICVDDKKLFKKFFGLDKSAVEIRRNADGTIKLSVIFILLDDKPSRTIPIPLTEVCLAELEQSYNVKFGWWVHRGMGQLNGTLGEIKANFIDLHSKLNHDEAIYFSESLLKMTEDQYWKESPANRLAFDRCACVMCLLIRKEFGEEKMLSFIKGTASGKDAKEALYKLYKFDSYSHFDVTLKAYMKIVASDIVENKTPNSYLQIVPK